MTLTEFLLARIAEDEAIAKRAEPHAEMFDPMYGEQFPVDAHIEHWPPARMLAECEAKRRIVEWLPEDDVLGDGWHDGWNHGHRYAMQLLALPYVDHPDYQQDWRP
jgi:hypothetical protein